ncbi:alpha/beta hydrolase [Segniliparus rugosus]|uniref:Alpha/beta hydrolase fold-3 domain-containing protein n=1 Tax=Segniliparus rugosus (strain ATCC BAA-974 / DSM 45345 / CCUG 50838 / CIP 108380 / JCM 13579 / CDC 945) TaxID=679197 RepID=E5XTN6_SEGRC|nr:alpha/beta hydrolase [Segniliparus rugosus]EFV12298.1 hypothetical protein HMPREF9336_02858 [Segniliparus rugosus ATCC BAA-974]
MGGRPVARLATLIPGAGEGIPARLYAPEGLATGSPLLVYYHGGGWVIGSLDTHDELCAYLAAASGIRVLSVDYRLAPEHQFPAAVLDADAAYRFARERAEELGADPGRIAVGGDSAGGTLASVVCQQSALEGRRPPDFGLLIYPAGDLIEQTESRRLFATGFFLEKPRIDWFSDCYCPPQLRDDPRSSPLRAPAVAGLPPVYVATAAFDPLCDEGEALAAKFAESGSAVTLRRHRGLVHGFANMASLSPGSMAALNEMAGALRSALGVPPGA